MIVTHKFRFRTGQLRLYAIGDPWLVRSASESTFSELGWKAKWDERKILTHYPGGWADRAGSAYGRACNMNPMSYYGTDVITIRLYPTNNVAVTLLRSDVYLKVNWFNKKKQAERLAKFFGSFEREFGKLKLRLFAETEWDALVAQLPELHCSPVWGGSSDGKTL